MSRAIDKYRQEVANKRRLFYETDNTNKRRRISKETEKLHDYYAGQLVPVATARWDMAISKYQRAEVALDKAEQDARYRLNKTAGEFVNIATARVNAAEADELKSLVENASSNAEAYALTLAIRARIRNSNNSTDASRVANWIGRDDYHDDSTYAKAYERAVKVAEETAQVHAECSEVNQEFSDTRLTLQLERWQPEQSYEAGGGIVTEYALLDDPADFIEQIESAIQQYGGEE